MSDLEKTIKIIFSGVDDLSKPMSAMDNAFGKLNDQVTSITQPLADFAASIEKVDAVLAVAIVGGIAASVSAYSEFESAMIKVKAVMGASEEDYQKLTELTRTLGAETMFTAQEAAEGLLVLAQAGLDADQALVALPTTLKFAQGGMIGIEEASEIALKAMNNFGLGVADLERVTDVLLATANLSMTSITDLGEGMKMVSPIANSLGMSIEETSAVLAKMADAGYKGEMGGTALRNILVAMIAPTDNASKLFKKLGVDTEELGIDLESCRTAMASLGVKIKDESTGNMRAFPDIMNDIIAGLDRLPDPMDKTATLMAAFGKRGGPQMAALLALGTDAIKDMLDKIKEAGNVTQLMADEVEKSLKYAIKVVISSFEGLGLEIGKGLKDGIVSGSQGLTTLVNAVVSEINAGSFQPLLDVFNDLGEDVKEYLVGIAQALPEAMDGVDFAGLVKSLQDLGNSILNVFKNAFGDLDLTRPADLAKAIQTVIDVSTKFVQVNKGLVEGLQPFIQGMVDLGKKFLESPEGVAELTGKIAGFGQGLNSASKALENIGPLLTLFTGSAILSAITNIGTIAAALASVPAAGVIAATTAVGGLATGAYLLTSKILEADEAMDKIDKTMAMSCEEVLAVKEAAEASAAALAKIPEVKKLMFQTDLDTAIEAMEDLNTCVTTFPEGFTTEFTLEKEKAQADLNEMRFQFEAFPPQTFLEFITDKKQIDDVALEVEGIPKLNEMIFAAKMENAEYIQDFMSEIGQDRNANFIIDITSDSREKFTSEMKEIVNEDGTTTWVNVGVDADSMKATKKELDEIPTEKQIEIKLQGQIDKELAMIEANAENVQAAMEWSAKLDIATVEADAQRMEAAFENTGSAIASYAGEIEGLFKKDWDKMNMAEFTAVRDAAAQALKLQLETHKANMKLIESQVKYEEAKAYALMYKKNEILIDTTGVEPALEEVMWQIIQKVQIKANESASQFLLGIV